MTNAEKKGQKAFVQCTSVRVKQKTSGKSHSEKKPPSGPYGARSSPNFNERIFPLKFKNVPSKCIGPFESSAEKKVKKEKNSRKT